MRHNQLATAKCLLDLFPKCEKVRIIEFPTSKVTQREVQCRHPERSEGSRAQKYPELWRTRCFAALSMTDQPHL